METTLHRWMLDNNPSDSMVYKEPFWRHYTFIEDEILGMIAKLITNNEVNRIDGSYTSKIDEISEIVGSHYSKSILHPVIKITIYDTTIVFRYNFYDYEVAIISEHEIDLPIDDYLFRSRGESFYYQGFPDKYILQDKYPDNRKSFMASITSRNRFHTFMYLLCKDIMLNNIIADMTI